MSSQNSGTAQKTILRNFRAGWLGHPGSVENFPQGLQHVLVPQAVDKRVQHGDHRCVKHSRHPVLLRGPAGVISQTREDEGPKESDTTGRWEAREEKGLARPPAAAILRTAPTVSRRDTGTAARQAGRTKTANTMITPSWAELSPRVLSERGGSSQKPRRPHRVHKGRA